MKMKIILLSLFLLLYVDFSGEDAAGDQSSQIFTIITCSGTVEEK